MLGYGSANIRTGYMSRGSNDPIWRDITPASSNIYTLGTNDAYWSGLHVNNALVHNSISLYGQDQMYDRKTLKWINAANTTDYAYINASTAGNLGFIAKSLLVFSANNSASAYKDNLNSSVRLNNSALYSNTNNDYSLGLEAYRWKTLYLATSMLIGGTTFKAYNTNNVAGVFIGPELISIS